MRYLLILFFFIMFSMQTCFAASRFSLGSALVVKIIEHSGYSGYSSKYYSVCAIKTDEIKCYNTYDGVNVREQTHTLAEKINRKEQISFIPDSSLICIAYEIQGEKCYDVQYYNRDYDTKQYNFEEKDKAKLFFYDPNNSMNSYYGRNYNGVDPEEFFGTYDYVIRRKKFRGSFLHYDRVNDAEYFSREDDGGVIFVKDNKIYDYSHRNLRKGRVTPRMINGIDGEVKKIVATNLTGCALLESGKIKCWDYEVFARRGWASFKCDYDDELVTGNISSYDAFDEDIFSDIILDEKGGVCAYNENVISCLENFNVSSCDIGHEVVTRELEAKVRKVSAFQIKSDRDVPASFCKTYAEKIECQFKDYPVLTFYKTPFTNDADVLNKLPYEHISNVANVMSARVAHIDYWNEDYSGNDLGLVLLNRVFQRKFLELTGVSVQYNTTKQVRTAYRDDMELLLLKLNVDVSIDDKISIYKSIPRSASVNNYLRELFLVLESQIASVLKNNDYRSSLTGDKNLRAYLKNKQGLPTLLRNGLLNPYTVPLVKLVSEVKVYLDASLK